MDRTTVPTLLELSFGQSSSVLLSRSVVHPERGPRAGRYMGAQM